MNYAQTVRELVGTMREDAWQCLPCHDCHKLPRIVQEQLTSTSRVVHDMFTSSSRTVHDYCATVACRCVGIYRASWTQLAIPEIASEDTTYITETTYRLKQSRQNCTTCHDKIVAKSRASVSLAILVKHLQATIEQSFLGFSSTTAMLIKLVKILEGAAWLNGGIFDS